MRDINSGYPNPTAASPALTPCRGGRLVRPAREASVRRRNYPQGLPRSFTNSCDMKIDSYRSKQRPARIARFLLIAQMYCQRDVASYVSTRFLLGHKVDHLAGDVDLFYKLLAGNRGFYFFVGECTLHDDGFARIDGYSNPAA
jgi:hypothetical protein